MAKTFPAKASGDLNGSSIHYNDIIFAVKILPRKHFKLIFLNGIFCNKNKTLKCGKDIELNEVFDAENESVFQINLKKVIKYRTAVSFNHSADFSNTDAWRTEIFPLVNEDGVTANIFGISKNITATPALQAKKQEEEIKTNKKILDAIINSASNNIIFLDENNRIAFFNATAEKNALNFFGKKLKEKASFLTYAKKEKKPDLLAYLAKVKQHEEITAEEKFHDYTGEKILCIVKYYPAYNERGKYKGCVVSYTDITEEKQQEQKIFDIKNTLNAVINNSSDNILFITPDNEIGIFNKAAYEHFLKLSGKKLQPGKSFFDFIPQNRKKIFIATIKQMKEKKEVVREHRVIYPNRDKAWFFRRFYPVFNNENKYIGYVINSTNIEKRKQYELKLAMQNQKLKEITRIQSHEIRRPLANILGLMELIKYKEVEDIELKQYLDLLKLSAEELDNVIRMVIKESAMMQ